MKEILQEFVNSIGFIGTVILAMLIVPIGLVNAFGVFSAEGGAFLFFLLLAGAIVLFLYHKQITKTDTDAVSAICRGTATEKQRGKFLSVEIAEMEQQKKQDHILRLPYLYDIYSLYHDGHPREDLGSSPQNIAKRLKVDLLIFLGNDSAVGKYFRYHLPRSETISYSYHLPQYLLSDIIQNMMVEHQCNKKQLETCYQKELEMIRWNITYHVLNVIYGYGRSVTQLSLYKDLSGYSLIYPFGLPPLEYIFDSNDEEETKFINEAIDRLEECKTIVRNMSRAEREKLCAELHIPNLTSYRFRQPQKGRSEK